MPRKRGCRKSAKCGGCREGAAEMPLLFPIDREIERKDEPPSNAGLIDEEKRAWIREHKRYIRPMVIINTRSVAFPPLILRSATEQRKKSEARKEEGMLEQEKER